MKNDDNSNDVITECNNNDNNDNDNDSDNANNNDHNDNDNNSFVLLLCVFMAEASQPCWGSGYTQQAHETINHNYYCLVSLILCLLL